MLKTIPLNIYKTPDPGHEPTESWFFHLLVMKDETPKHLHVDLMNDELVVESVHCTEKYLDAVKGIRFKLSPDSPPMLPSGIPIWKKHLTCACLSECQLRCSSIGCDYG
ncbi:MAG: hypothetical protein L0154_14460 [Chloroflexi bacterium]|nr:hypothetical protein [Chloroflexota bacterium]